MRGRAARRPHRRHPHLPSRQSDIRQTPTATCFARTWPLAQIPSDYLPPQADVNTVPIHRIGPLVPESGNFTNVAVILVKRDATGTPYFKYFGNGAQGKRAETWSSSKVFAVMNGAGRLGAKCGPSSAGLWQSTQGKYGATPLGDLATIIVTYSTAFPPYSSNGLGGWFEMLGTRERARHPVKSWLMRPNETYGANYGAAPPSDLAFTFQPGNCSVVPDSAANGGNANHLSALTMAEMVKRAVLARELPQKQQWPGTIWEDAQNLLYGANRSTFFPGLTWGGMSANADDQLRLGLDMAEIERRSSGKWRTFSKDGCGNADYLINGYACYSDASNPANGVEYVVSARVSASTLMPAGRSIRQGMTAINKAIYNQILK